MERVRVAADRWNFELAESGRFITPIGGNMLNDEHPCHGTFFRHFDANDVDYRLGCMADLGLNCLRQAIGVNEVFSPGTGLKADGLNHWDTFIRLAEKHGIYLMPVGGYLGGNDWFDVERLADNGRSLDEACAFWEAFVGHYRNHPAIWAWDLRNELLYDAKEHFVKGGESADNRVVAMLKDAWPAWLECRYGTVGTMNHAYGSTHGAFSDVPGSIRFEEKPFDLCTHDFRVYLNERGYRWCKRQCDVIREVSPLTMIVSGNNTWLSPDQDLWLANGFHNRAIHDLFDFITFHPYPALQVMPDGRGDPVTDTSVMAYWVHSCIANARFDYYGKPVVVQEFGWYGGGESRFLCDLPYRSEEQHADYMDRFTAALAPHVNGFINWPTMDMPAASDISNHGGIFTHDGHRKKLAAVFGTLSGLSGRQHVRPRGTVILEYSLLGLYTSRPYMDRMFDEIHEVMMAGEIPDFRFV